MMARVHRKALPLLLGLLWPAVPALAGDTQPFEARVIDVIDGDTITVSDSGQVQHGIRLVGIAAPEMTQPFGDRSKQSLLRMVADKDVRIEPVNRDSCGRLVAMVWVTPQSLPCANTGEPCPKTLDVGRGQLTVGLAWYYEAYEHEQSEQDRLAYAFDETEARARKVGLWADPRATPPWEWRQDRTGDAVEQSGTDHCEEPGDLN